MQTRLSRLCLATVTLTLALSSACGDGGETTDTAETETSGDASTSSSTVPTTTDPTTTGATEDTSEDTEDTDDTDDTTTDEPPFPVGGCGLDDYPVLDAADMGEILAHEFVIEFEPETINALLIAQNFEALTPVEYGARVYKIRYRTQDRGEAVEATGFVSFPVTGEPAQDHPVVMWAHGTTGFTDECAPTAAADGYAIPAMLAALGFVAVAPDYLGMNGWGAPSGFLHPYIVPEPTAIACLDSLRALVRFAGDTDTDLPSTPGSEVVLFGASEGGFATLWADRYAPHYAPEFNIVANIASVPPTDTLGLTRHGATVFGPTTGALAAAIVGGHSWHRLETPLDAVLSDDPPAHLATELPNLMMTTCNIDIPDTITDTSQVYQAAFVDALVANDLEALGEVGCILERASLASSEIPLVSTTPTLVILGELDDLVYTPVVREDLPGLCEQGYLLEHLECAGLGHTPAAVQSIPYAIAWTHDRLAGTPLADPCTIHEPVVCADL